MEDGPPSYFGIDGGAGRRSATAGLHLVHAADSDGAPPPRPRCLAHSTVARRPREAPHSMYAKFKELRNALRARLPASSYCQRFYAAVSSAFIRGTGWGCRAHAVAEPHACPFDHFLDPTALQTHIRSATVRFSRTKGRRSRWCAAVCSPCRCATNARQASCDGDEWGAASVEGVGDENGRRRQPRVVKLFASPL